MYYTNDTNIVAVIIGFLVISMVFTRKKGQFSHISHCNYKNPVFMTIFLYLRSEIQDRN